LAASGGESGDEGLGEGTSPGDQCYLAYWMTKLNLRVDKYRTVEKYI